MSSASDAGNGCESSLDSTGMRHASAAATTEAPTTTPMRVRNQIDPDCAVPIQPEVSSCYTGYQHQATAMMNTTREKNNNTWIMVHSRNCANGWRQLKTSIWYRRCSTGIRT